MASDSSFLDEEDSVLLDLECEESDDSLDTGEDVEDNENNTVLAAIDPSNILPYRYEPEAESDSEHGEGAAQTQHVISQDIGRLQNTEWCTCANCDTQPTVTESICCQEIPTIAAKLDEMESATCITQHRVFPKILDPDILQIMHFGYAQQYGDNQHLSVHRRYRYICYRAYVRWCWGWLGKDIRVPLPSCVVTAVRQKFPDPDFVGFMYPSLNLD